jgi:hypothetical protein
MVRRMPVRETFNENCPEALVKVERPLVISLMVTLGIGLAGELLSTMRPVNVITSGKALQHIPAKARRIVQSCEMVIFRTILPVF